MHLLVAINNNTQEWLDTTGSVGDIPRLPIPYAFGAALLDRGHTLSAVDVYSMANKRFGMPFFKNIYHKDELGKALKNVDAATLWGGFGISALIRQIRELSTDRKVILNTFTWQTGSLFQWKNKKLEVATRIASRFAKGLVVMTHEQKEMASRFLPSTVPVFYLQCGIDTEFYRKRVNDKDIPIEYSQVMEKILKRPYIIMPGDELRLNFDAINMLEDTDYVIVRISQYSNKSRTDLLKREIRKRQLEDRIFLFEGISYSFLRYLIKNAAVYSGFVDSTWQPAGWTVACESLASGVPVVLYDGIVARELKRLGVSNEYVRVVQMGDIVTFRNEIQRFMTLDQNSPMRKNASDFMKTNLDIRVTGAKFADQLANQNIVKK